MGTMVAPTYACLFMSWLETEVILKTWTGRKPLMYRRFIDDIFFVWDGPVSELEEFLTHMNSTHSHIKFTSTYNTETRSVPFLDMTVSIEDGQFVTDLYKKETAVCQYLLPSSCHPGHQTRNIPYSLAYRLRRICSKEALFEHRLKELKSDLLSRQYNYKIIMEAFDRARKIPRAEALKKVEKTPSQREVFALTYHPGLPSVTNLVRKHWSVMVKHNNSLGRCFPQPSMIAYRRARSLRDHLVKAKISNTRKSTRLKNGFKPCQGGCKLCWISEKSTTHKCQRLNKSWNINAPLDCNTENVIYKLSCRNHPSFCYIGETRRRFRDRVQEHRGYITQKRLNHPIGEHFNLPGHSKNPVADLLPLAIERVLPKGDHTLRKQRESYWINQYDSITYGANTRD